MRIFLILLLINLSLFSYDKDTLFKMIGNMLIVGFKGETLPKEIKKDIFRYHLGGVILFDKKGDRVKNIKNPSQLKKLTKEIKETALKAGYKILICVDEEGGWVQRLKGEGFIDTPSAFDIGKRDNIKYTKKVYEKLSKELFENGFNCDFAPVLDIAINSKNKVIVKAKRSYGNLQKVIKHSEIFIKALKRRGIISVLKHFPGHGSSFGDTHKGFVDVTKSWKRKELFPYLYFIQKNLADMIMIAHIYNKKLDKRYIATFSSKIKKNLLRRELGFRGVIVSDDMQMKAVSRYWSLKDALRLAINSETDMLLFANQGKSDIKVSKIVNIIYNQILHDKIKIDRIIEANKRINRLKKSIR